MAERPGRSDWGDLKCRQLQQGHKKQKCAEHYRIESNRDMKGRHGAAHPFTIVRKLDIPLIGYRPADACRYVA